MRKIGSVPIFSGGVFEVVEGDLLEQPVDAIVNAANGHLEHAGGVAGIISRAAGPQLQEESAALVRAHGAFSSGEAVATSAGKLPFKAVIHAIGPRYGEGDEERKLTLALSSAFSLASRHGWQSVAFPAVSGGIFGVPPDSCARAYLTAGRSAPLRNLRLCLRDQPLVNAVLREMQR
jgi:O-acetyl-ADP-ribose deacetylase (regulator of RNase III)